MNNLYQDYLNTHSTLLSKSQEEINTKIVSKPDKSIQEEWLKSMEKSTLENTDKALDSQIKKIKTDTENMIKIGELDSESKIYNSLRKQGEEVSY